MKCKNTTNIITSPQDSATTDNFTSTETVSINCGNDDIIQVQKQPIRDFWSSLESLDSDDDLSLEDDGGSDSCQRNFQSPEVRLPQPTDAVQFDATREIVPVSTKRFYRSTIFLDVWQINTFTAEQRDGSVFHLHEFSRTDFKQWLPADQHVLPYPPEDDQSWPSDVDRSWFSDEELGRPLSSERHQNNRTTSDDEGTWEFYDEELWASAGDGNIQPPSDEEKMSALIEDPELPLPDHTNGDTIVTAADETVEAIAELAAPKRRSFLSFLGRRLMNDGRKMFCCGVGRGKRHTKL